MDDEIIRVRRVIEYEGPRKWIEETVKNSLNRRNGGDTQFSRITVIREISCDEVSLCLFYQ